MELYIEYVILDNLVIDYMILKFLEITLGGKISKIRKFLTCFCGTIFALIMPFLYGFNMLLIVYRIISSIVMVLCIKKYKTFKNFILCYLLFVTYTFLLGGLILGIIQIFNIDYSMSGIFMYKFEFPISVFALIVLLLTKLFLKFMCVVKKKLKTSNYLYEVVLIDNGNIVKTIAFFDTGNNVNDENMGVNIISINLFLRICKDVNFENIVLKNIEKLNLKDTKYIDIKSIGHEEKYLSFVVDCLEVNGNKYNNSRVAVAMKNFGEYDLILHKDYVGG